jgi:hypothetical protein
MSLLPLSGSATPLRRNVSGVEAKFKVAGAVLAMAAMREP